LIPTIIKTADFKKANSVGRRLQLILIEHANISQRDLGKAENPSIK
jgi:hypothetical protein